MSAETRLDLGDVILRARWTAPVRRFCCCTRAGNAARSGRRSPRCWPGAGSGRATTLRALAGDVAGMIGSRPAPIVLVGASVGGLAAIAALADPVVAARASGLVLVDVVPDLEPARVRSWLGFHGLGGHPGGARRAPSPVFRRRGTSWPETLRKPSRTSCRRGFVASVTGRFRRRGRAGKICDRAVRRR
ncbi:hypothetical protein LCL61_00120 [Amycolatopsis coloradensis]|uniref:Uncharacterized protein n=1 Tax=Amycolatopsis coloradensis TaxID=76021 RepID=A0ACD5B3Q8_9PSEU